MPFRSDKQREYLRVNKPDVYAKLEAHTPEPPKDVKPSKKPRNRFVNYPSNRELATWNGKLG